MNEASQPTDLARTILSRTESIAIVGASERPERDSHRVMRYLMRAGFQVFPVNPMIDAVLGQPCVAQLTDLRRAIDTVVCFRRSELIGAIADQALQIGAKHLWMQLGVINEAAYTVATRAGLLVVMDRCIMVDHQRFEG